MTNTQNLDNAHADLAAALVWRYAEDVQEILDDLIEPGTALDADPAYANMAIRERHEALDADFREEHLANIVW